MASSGFTPNHAPPPQIRVILADDYGPLRTVIRSILNRCEDISVIGEAASGYEALRLVDSLRPDVLLLDMEMPGIDGIEVARKLRTLGNPVAILVLSAYNDRHYVFSVIEEGAAGYLMKDESPAKIVEAIRRVARGESGWFSEEIRDTLKQHPTNPTRGDVTQE